ncbi:hypothetical protein HAL013_07120 [Helicobacter ailurogastricus]|uniref:Uncharacterized protein n=1 Tax=Helicobacter ailurogastricus TaxID=1578720 RepID=A0A0K2XCR9_9HELI|nr:hypothetical protein HAL011_16130 [Helicobacter ailurogastricus]CRF42524.1 hypothetical protein HAL013_07120 [Helicobacter ailurogastricus]CRF44170.1 hypothetical protein HAL09_07430 [Helicobacter ailurogastricus]
MHKSTFLFTTKYTAELGFIFKDWRTKMAQKGSKEWIEQ